MRPKRNIKFWAITASIAVHLIVLTAFAVVKFSPSQAQASQRPAAMATVTAMQKLIEPEKIIPKPKIKSSSQGKKITKRSEEILPAGEIFVSPDKNPDSSASAMQNFSDLTKPPVSTADSSLPAGGQTVKKIEFFGSRTASGKVCYLVDCSGSMRGLFKRVQKNLKNSVQSMQPDQYFSIIFFGNDKLLEYGDGLLFRASDKNKVSACEFIDTVQPAGQTNTLAALERAVQIKDSHGDGPLVIYFLTDGFELAGENETLLPGKIASLLKRTAATKVNTIGFWPAKKDAEILKMIAETSGGEFVNIIN